MEEPQSYALPPKAPHQQTESNVLPPINGLPMQAQYQQMYSHNNSSHPGSVPGSMPQTPITPHTPIQHTSSAPPDPTGYAQAGANSAPPRTLHPPPTYPSNQPGIAAIANQTHGYAHMLPRINQQPPHLANLMATPGYVNREPEPTHVVGQQGRRGILPSVAGRPTPNGKMAIPAKNEEGKFPCPHCTKTYLHAKHLKRHMLRHTGDRPYQCKLCKDTFSRSDILKRHFQKCSIRRGHTGDQNHLEGSRNHLKQNQNRHSTGSIGDMPYVNGGATSGAEYQPAMPSQYMNPVQDFIAGQDFNNGVQQSLSNRSSRSNSLMRGPNDYAVSMGGMAPSMHAYSMGQQNPTPYPNFPVSSADMASASQTRTANAHMTWSGGYQTQASEGFMYNQQAGNGDVKPEQEMATAGDGNNAQTGIYQNMYGSSSSSLPQNQTVFDSWNLGDFGTKAAALVSYCFQDGLPRTRNELSAMSQLKVILTADNIKRYLQLFRDSWNEHWPTIHMPTFESRILQANNGLLLTMMCIGAIYSVEMSLDMERWLMVLVRQAIMRKFATIQFATGASIEHSGFEYSSNTVEEIEALVLLQSMFIWHGNHEQRQQARDDFKLVVLIARKCRLTEPIPYGQKGYSMLHQSYQHQANMDLTKWDWQAWTQQEERSRVMHQIFLIDCALAMFFNEPPQLSSNEIRIQLPADDAAWDAPHARACMDALGMNGDEAQRLSNVSGSLRLTQPEFHLCIQLLFSSQSEFAPRTTNIYSKFLLIHALHAAIWNLQNKSLAAPGFGAPGSVSLPDTPLSQHDWVLSAGPYNASNPSSGRASPAQAFPQADTQEINSLKFAIEKWKRAYETDIDLQYPSPSSRAAVPGQHAPRRVGFCRDAVHYYWLAKQFLQSPRNFNWRAHSEPDQRMGFVMLVLQQIAQAVAREGYRLGKELGSVVDIKEAYAKDMSKLNMRDLFVALPGSKF